MTLAHRGEGRASTVPVTLLDLVSEVGELAKEMLRVTEYRRRPFTPADGWQAERRVGRVARYDGLADWYDRYISTDARPLTELARATLCELLGPGRGRCLDLGCGGGIAISPLASMGWSVVGVDESADQLRVATSRAGAIAEQLVRADAAALPFEDGSFDAVASMFLHTDVDDIGSVFTEAARVLRPGGRLVYVGTHPCFVGPFIERGPDQWIVRPGYAAAGWHRTGPGLGDGVRRRVGVRHVPLAELLNAVTTAGFLLELVAEPGPSDLPSLLGIAARRL